jgi:hypothetical protein
LQEGKKGQAYSNLFDVQARIDAIARQIYLGNQLIVSSFVIDSNLHFLIGGFDERMIAGEDYLYSVKAIRQCSSFVFLNACLGGYRLEANPKLRYYVPGSPSTDRLTLLKLNRALTGDHSIPFLLLRVYLLLAFGLLCFEDASPYAKVAEVSSFVRKAIGLLIAKLSGSC